jgi:RNA polymerase sigma-70 factor (ECF subfamily)
MAKSRLISDADELAPTRLSLIERLRDLDDQGSWQEFFDTYWKLIYCAAIKGGLPDDEAEDVVQETIIGIARNMENFRYEPEVCSFKGWLMHVTRCRIIDHLRKNPAAKYSFVPIETDTKTGEKLEAGPQPVQPGCASEQEFENLWDEEWKKNLVDAAMERVKRKVTPEHYQIFYLHSVKGMLGRDIAELFGASLAKVYVIRHRVARLIKQEVRSLEQKGWQR